ncbi:hypothetical protein Z517_10337 [Fonsecaea pedrosoi CBS 271.37]|uniref:Uncharacterized protein n=1 Tax=Fonsecaea pedrosoi CBS 271.37 TaxID=1442368 RepID=A0A0D2G9W0_9EURO|nr:uncharacterized protein Z517_10337 [Fonsecaea pedrosoi CBS 271.37]KIW75595.1 hypothetical protein Z517_10337 [Fonsecaea pedrosoi CBS 271.37]
MDTATLDIDRRGRARTVLPRASSSPPKKPRSIREPHGPELVIDNRGYARAVFPNSNTNLHLDDVHLRVGRYEESYERTKFPDEDLDVEAKEVVPQPARFRLHQGDDPRFQAPVTPQNGNLAMVPAPPRYQHGSGIGEIKEIERREAEEDQVQQATYQLNHIPVLPPIIWVKRADAYTRLRYAVDVVTVHGEKYIRIDEIHFLCAVNADWLQTGEDVTIRRVQYRHWQAGRRVGRPEILFVLYPLGELAYTPTNNRRKKAPLEFRPQLDNYGRVLLNAFDRPLKFSNVMPGQISTEIEGWEMEAICRLDPDICHQDFIDRMLPNPGPGKNRPSKGTLNHRRRRDRMKMRVVPWPLPRQLSYSDQQVINELTVWQMENNTTMGLRDLSKEEIEMQEAIMYGGHFERSGANAQNDRARLEQFWANLRLVRTKFAEDSEEVR